MSYQWCPFLIGAEENKPPTQPRTGPQGNWHREYVKGLQRGNQAIINQHNRVNQAIINEYDPVLDQFLIADPELDDNHNKHNNDNNENKYTEEKTTSFTGSIHAPPSFTGSIYSKREHQYSLEQLTPVTIKQLKKNSGTEQPTYIEVYGVIDAITDYGEYGQEHYIKFNDYTSTMYVHLNKLNISQHQLNALVADLQKKRRYTVQIIADLTWHEDKKYINPKPDFTAYARYIKKVIDYNEVTHWLLSSIAVSMKKEKKEKQKKQYG